MSESRSMQRRKATQKGEPMPTFSPEPAYTEQDLREAKAIHELLNEEGCGFFEGGDKCLDCNLIAERISTVRSEARAGMREACAKHWPHPRWKECACGHKILGKNFPLKWSQHVRSLPDQAADEAIERIREEAHEKGMREGASNEVLLQKMFNEDGPVKRELERVKAAARLEEMKEQEEFWDRPSIEDGDVWDRMLERIAELTAAAKESKPLECF